MAAWSRPLHIEVGKEDVVNLGEEGPEQPGCAPMCMPISGISCNQRPKKFGRIDWWKGYGAEVPSGVHMPVPEPLVNAVTHMPIPGISRPSGISVHS